MFADVSLSSEAFRNSSRLRNRISLVVYAFTCPPYPPFDPLKSINELAKFFDSEPPAPKLGNNCAPDTKSLAPLVRTPLFAP